jgi:hypothetical protein
MVYRLGLGVLVSVLFSKSAGRRDDEPASFVTAAPTLAASATRMMRTTENRSQLKR